MTRILCWNIEQFRNEKFFGDRRGRIGPLVPLGLDWIVAHIENLDPCVFIIVEPTGGNPFQLLRTETGGAQGALNLLNFLRGHWRLVPMLNTGGAESVAVFFRSDRVQFSGPFVWPGGRENSVAPMPGLVTGPYPDGRWTTVLPNVLVDARSAFNPGIAQDRCAGRVNGYTNRDGGLRWAPPGNQRAPFQTTFFDLVGNRNLNIFTIHGPAAGAGPAYIGNLARCQQVVQNLQNNEIRRVLGDFNAQLIDVNGIYQNIYQDLIDAGFNVELRNLLNLLQAPPVPLNGYLGYFTTALSGMERASCWRTNNVDAYYPAYYFRNEFFSIDNILTLGLPDLAENAQRISVINALVGSPYNMNGMPDGTPTGNPNLIMPRQLDWMQQNPPPRQGNVIAGDIHGPPFVGGPAGNWAGVRDWFRTNQVYGRARRVSDHLPLCIDF